MAKVYILLSPFSVTFRLFTETFDLYTVKSLLAHERVHLVNAAQAVWQINRAEAENILNS